MSTIYYAYSIPEVYEKDKFGNIENNEKLQSRYQEINPEVKAIQTRSAFKVGDERIWKSRCGYTFNDKVYEKWGENRHIIEDDSVSETRVCFYLEDTSGTNAPISGKTMKVLPSGKKGMGSTRYLLTLETGKISTASDVSWTDFVPAIYQSQYRQSNLYQVYYETNIPIFENKTLAQAYYNGTADVSTAMNYGKSFNPATNEWEDAPETTTGLIAFYMDDAVYDLQLVANVDIDTVRWSNNGVDWTYQDNIEYFNFISPYEHEIDNFYYKSILWQTNIPIFKTLDDANSYLDGTGSIDIAVNVDEITENIDKDVALGEVIDGEMGLNSTSLRGAFCSRYAVNNSTLSNITNAFFTDDGTILENLKEGLELYGQTPMDSIIDLTYYPFDVGAYGTVSPQNYIYFGRYQLALQNSVNKIVNLNTTIDCGKINYPITYGDYRDYEPYTECYLYLPYCGVHRINIAEYIGKTIGLKYGIDVTTGACEAFLTSDGRILNRFAGQIGVRQFITSMDSATYTANVTNSILNSGGDVVGTTIGAVGQLASGNVGGALANVGGLAFGGFKGISNFKKATSNVPYQTRGSATSMLNQYDIQYPFFIFVYQKIYPCNDLNIVGKPTNVKGSVKNFAGFLKCADIKLETNASDTEISMIENLLKQGVYI